tara:strand:- start:83 stop:1075 length:993 start_codon:yes stop_codon:yes gene_type:complete
MSIFKTNIQSRIAARLRGKSAPILSANPSRAGDLIDTIPNFDAVEDPESWEAKTGRMFADAEADPAFANVLEVSFLEQDVAKSYRRCADSLAPKAISDLLLLLGVKKTAPIADVGSGRGHFPNAMSLLGHSDITVMEPNSNFYTGTGYLKSLDNPGIKIINDIPEWRSVSNRFDAVTSYATVHHWQHIPQVMIDLRRTLKADGYWLMCSEFIANDAKSFVKSMYSHPTAFKYNSYEWSYPASVYVDLAESVGLKLVGVIPMHYHGNALQGQVGGEKDHGRLDAWVEANLLRAGGTVEAFWDEVDHFRRHRKGKRYYTQPQAMIFQRHSPD